MNIKIIRILVGIVALAMVPTVRADDDFYDTDIEYEDYEVFDDVEDLIDEELYESIEDVVEPVEVIAVVDDIASESVVEPQMPRVVADRMSCDEINARVAELQADVKSYPELKSDLEYMLSRQRNQCAPRAARRPVHNYKNVNPVTDVEVPEVAVSVVEPVEPEKTSEEIAAEEAAAEAERLAQIEINLSNGLCGDGTKPNKYGCCTGEVFKQLEHLSFACCPKDGDGDCVEPRRK